MMASIEDKMDLSLNDLIKTNKKPKVIPKKINSVPPALKGRIGIQRNGMLKKKTGSVMDRIGNVSKKPSILNRLGNNYKIPKYHPHKTKDQEVKKTFVNSKPVSVINTPAPSLKPESIIVSFINKDIQNPTAIKRNPFTAIAKNKGMTGMRNKGNIAASGGVARKPNGLIKKPWNTESSKLSDRFANTKGSNTTIVQPWQVIN